jgi:hypothetical protein
MRSLDRRQFIPHLFEHAVAAAARVELTGPKNIFHICVFILSSDRPLDSLHRPIDSGD